MAPARSACGVGGHSYRAAMWRGHRTLLAHPWPGIEAARPTDPEGAVQLRQRAALAGFGGTLISRSDVMWPQNSMIITPVRD